MSAWLVLLAGLGSGPDLPPVSALLDCARETDITLVAAHRAGGFASGVPENSLAGIRAAAELGAAFAEVDLRETADGAIVLMHDVTLDRTTTGTGAVSDYTLDQLRRFRLVDLNGAETGERIPTLEDAFETAREAGIYLELDLKGIAPDRAAQIVHDAHMSAYTIIIVYDADDAAPIQAVSRDIGISLPFGNREEVPNSELDFSALVSWMGRGIPDARTEAFLTGQGIETAMHDFPGERDGSIDYAFIDAMHIELLASDNPAEAIDVLGTWRGVCPR